MHIALSDDSPLVCAIFVYRHAQLRGTRHRGQREQALPRENYRRRRLRVLVQRVDLRPERLQGLRCHHQVRVWPRAALLLAVLQRGNQIHEPKAPAVPNPCDPSPPVMAQDVRARRIESRQSQYTCSLEHCQGCATCESVTAGTHCSPWCNSFTCFIELCTGCALLAKPESRACSALEAAIYLDLCTYTHAPMRMRIYTYAPMLGPRGRPLPLFALSRSGCG
jgi:hypothetical protein